MARFYRTTSANPLDYMYQANIPLMKEVLLANEGAIDNSLDYNDQYRKLANFNYLDADAEEAAKVRQDIEAKADEISKNILADPANWRNQQDPLRQFSRSVADNYTNGPISKYVGNYNRRKSMMDQVAKQVELYHTSGGEKGVDPTRANAYINDWDNKFTGTKYDPKNPTGYNIYKGGQVMDNINIKKALSDGLDKLKADTNLEYHSEPTGNDWYINKTTGKREEVTPQKILEVVGANINPQIGQYLQQDKSVGLIGEDVDVDFNSAYKYDPVEISSSEQANIKTIKDKIASTKNPNDKKILQGQLDAYTASLSGRRSLNWNEKNYFAPLLNGLVNQFSYRNTESGNDLKGNPKGAAVYSQGMQNLRQGRQLQQQMAIHNDTQRNMNARLKETLGLGYARIAEDRYEWDNPHDTKGSKSSSVKKETIKSDSNLPDETSLSRLATRSFEDITVKANGKDVPLLSTVGLAASVNNLSNQQKFLETQLGTVNKILENQPTPGDIQGLQKYNQAKLDKQNIELNLNKVRADLNDSRTWYKATDEHALTQVAKADADLYKEFTGDRTGTKYRESIEKLKKQYPDIQTTSNLTTGQGANIQVRGTLKESPQVEAARQKLADYFKAKSRIDAKRDDILATARKTMIDSDAIRPSKKDNQFLSPLIISNSQGLKMFDDQGHSTAGVEIEGKGISWFNSGGDNYNLTFANGQLQDYMNRYGVTMEVEEVGPTTKLGTGNAVAKVRFNDPTGNISNKKPYYIELTPELQKDVAAKFKGHKNTDIARLANTIDDDEANSIRNQISRPSFKDITGKVSDDGHFNIDVAGLNREVIRLNAIKMGGNKLMVTFTGPNGQIVDFPSKNGGGLFESPDDFIQQFKEFRERKAQEAQR